jgi:flagellar biogenesis protein FliO
LPDSVTAELILRFIGLLGLLGATWWYVKRRMPRKFNSAGLRITSRTGLSRGAVLAVVEVENKTLLIGATDQTVTLLSELDTSPPVDDLIEEGTPTISRPRMDLVRNLQRMTLRRPNHRKPPRVIRP